MSLTSVLGILGRTTLAIGSEVKIPCFRRYLNQPRMEDIFRWTDRGVICCSNRFDMKDRMMLDLMWCGLVMASPSRKSKNWLRSNW